MKLWQVFDFFIDPSNDRTWWPLAADNIESVPLLTAAVKMSGMMDDCQTPADLADAVNHTMTLVGLYWFSVKWKTGLFC